MKVLIDRTSGKPIKFKGAEKINVTLVRFNLPEQMWLMDIPDIYKFAKKVGQCIVIPPGDYAEPYDKYHKVEIYDDYRE